MTTIVLVALCAAILGVSARRPQNGVLVIAALVPFHGLTLISPVPPVYWKEAAVLAVLAGCLVAPRPRGRRVVAPWLWPTALYVAVGTASALLVLGTSAAFPVKIAFFYLLLALVVVAFPFTRRDKDRLVTILLVTGVISAVYGLAQQVLGGDALVAMGYQWNENIRTAGPLLRSIGTFNQPFPFGLFLMLVLLVGAPAALAEPGRLRSRLFWILAPVILAAMICSVVRASYVGLVVGALVIGVVAFRTVLVVLSWLLGIVLVLGGGALALGAGGGIDTLLSPSSLEQRGGHWTTTIPLLLTQPFGQGMGTTGSAAERAGAAADAIGRTYQPDNYYVKLALELGPLGLALFLAILVLALVTLRRLVQHLEDPLERAFAAGALGMVAASCVAAFVSTYWEIFPLDLYFWVVLAAAGSAPLMTARAVMGRPSAPARRGAVYATESTTSAKRARNEATENDSA